VSVPTKRNSNTIQLCMTICMTHHTKYFLGKHLKSGCYTCFFTPSKKPFQIDTQKQNNPFCNL
jgi:hypothetical protein